MIAPVPQSGQGLTRLKKCMEALDFLPAFLPEKLTVSFFLGRRRIPSNIGMQKRVVTPAELIQCVIGEYLLFPLQDIERRVPALPEFGENHLIGEVEVD